MEKVMESHGISKAQKSTSPGMVRVLTEIFFVTSSSASFHHLVRGFVHILGAFISHLQTPAWMQAPNPREKHKLKL